MITVTAVYVDDSLAELTVKGHGGMEYGRDVICAGVSACTIGALNALEHAENYEIKHSSGLVEVKRIQKSSAHDEVVLETLIVQLSTISKSYPQNVKFTVSGKEGI